MTDFVTLDVDDLGVDRIATSPTAFALYENLFAFAEKASGAPTSANNYIVAAMIATSQITTGKIVDGNVTAGKLASTSTERDWILALLAGLTAGGVGTLAFARNTGATLAFGATIAGSSLLPANASGTNSGTVTGTWRCLGWSDSSGTPDESTTLFIRIA